MSGGSTVPEMHAAAMSATGLYGPHFATMLRQMDTLSLQQHLRDVFAAADINHSTTLEPDEVSSCVCYRCCAGGGRRATAAVPLLLPLPLLLVLLLLGVLLTA